jgi:hypothetical protein
MREREFTKTRVLMTNERTLAERAAGLADEALRRRAEGRRAKGCAPLVRAQPFRNPIRPRDD